VLFHKHIDHYYMQFTLVKTRYCELYESCWFAESLYRVTHIILARCVSLSNAPYDKVDALTEPPCVVHAATCLVQVRLEVLQHCCYKPTIPVVVNSTKQ
jgi:hypothetical protein